MFTGIIEETGIIKEIRAGGESYRIVIGAKEVLEGTRIGDSINTDGICLTVVSLDGGSFSADVMPETVRRTSLREMKAGSRVNLERALKLSDRLGGHLVSGHVDGTGIILKKRTEANAIWMTVSADRGLMKYIAEKGSVSLDGISLTVAKVDGAAFEVSLIPHTRTVTALTGKGEGRLVNIECDLIAKYIEALLGTQTGKRNITPEYLAEEGFL